MSKRVTVRSKMIKDNRSSLYLDFYPPVFNRKTKKKSRRESTSYWIYNDFKSETTYYFDDKGKKQSKIQVFTDKKGIPKKINLTALQKHHNKQMLESAELLRQKRFKELTKADIYTEEEIKSFERAEKRQELFNDYFKKLSESATKSVGAWSASYRYFDKFFGNVVFSDINKSLIEDFKKKLLTADRLNSDKHKIKRNTAASYFIKFIQALELAYEDNYLSENFKRRVEWIKEEEVSKNFLTLDECNILFKSKCPDEALKMYSIFAFLTGLRFSDIYNLRWEDISKRADIVYINFQMQKTKAFQYHPISSQAVEIMGKRTSDSDFIFDRIAYHSLNNNLRAWLSEAEINKKVTFHNFRTSYAVAQLEAGADIYLISKMLGHKNVSTTEIYAKIVDERKDSTVNNIILDI